jgi:hypothetical protein
LCRYTVNGAVSGFGPLIVSTFGYSALESILFQFPLGAVSAVGMVLAGWLCSRRRDLRIPSLVLCCLPVLAGYATIWRSAWGRRPVAPVVGYSLGAGNVAGETKKSFMAAAIFVAYCVGNIVGPQLVRSETKAEHYPALWTGLIILYVARDSIVLSLLRAGEQIAANALVCLCSYVVTILAASALYVILFRENKRREQLGVDEREKDRIAFKDLTDIENPYFRYVL